MRWRDRRRDSSGAFIYHGDVGRLVYITTPNRSLDEIPPEAIISDDADFADMKRQSHSFSAMTQFRQQKFKLDRPGLSVSGAAVDAEFFSTLGAAPELGRAINAENNQPDSAVVVIISHSVWQQLFDSDPAVLGKSLRLSGKAYRVIGVMAAGFNYPHQTELDDGGRSTALDASPAAFSYPTRDPTRSTSPPQSQRLNTMRIANLKDRPSPGHRI